MSFSLCGGWWVGGFRIMVVNGGWVSVCGAGGWWWVSV